MKQFYTIVFLILGYSALGQTYLLKKEYINVKGKQKISVDQSGIKNGISEYYNTKAKLDSTVTYKDGKQNGIKTYFYAEDHIIYSDYVNDSLVHQIILNKSNVVKYESPFDVSKVEATTFKFLSGRTYFDLKKTDTLVINTKVPEMNLNIYFPGATVHKINYYTFIIKDWKSQPGTKNGKVVVDIIQDIFTDTKLLREEYLYPGLQ